MTPADLAQMRAEIARKREEEDRQAALRLEELREHAQQEQQRILMVSHSHVSLCTSNY